MHGSFERCRRVLAGEKPDRSPVFDLIANDAVLKYFNDETPVKVGDVETALRNVYPHALDATRYTHFAPMAERIEYLSDGRERRYERWTIWTAPRSFASSEEYAEEKKRDLDGWEERLADVSATSCEFYQEQRRLRALMNDDFYMMLYTPCPGLMEIYDEIGLAQFSLCLAECEDVVVEQLERNTQNAVRWIETLPEDDPFDCLFVGDDMAFKNGPMISPRWLEAHYYHRLARVVEAAHKSGRKIVFHSDGNLNMILDGLVGAGIDGLNPIEVAAGMDLEDLHQRYPDLVFVGGIDASRLLPFGKPEEVRDAVVRAIETTEGRILVGSTTEVGNDVPLENFLAMRDTVLGYEY